MAGINRAGMGNRRTLQYNRVANDIFKFANSYHGSDGLHPVGDEWYPHHGPNKMTFGTHASKPYTIQSPTYYPTYASTPPPRASSKHVTRHSS